MDKAPQWIAAFALYFIALASMSSCAAQQKQAMYAAHLAGSVAGGACKP